MRFYCECDRVPRWSSCEPTNIAERLVEEHETYCVVEKSVEARHGRVARTAPVERESN